MQTDLVYDAIAAGARTADEIKKYHRKIKLPNIHPLLNRLRNEGSIAGFNGDLRVVRPRKERAA